jgi:integrase
MPRYDLWRHPDNRRFYVTWTIGGRSHRASTRTADRGEAQEFLKAFILEHDRPPEARPDQISIATVLDNYWKRHAERLPAAEAIGYRIRHLKKFFGPSAVDAVNARSMDRYKERCLSDGFAIGTINLHRGALRAALKRAVRDGELAVAPFVPADREPPPRAEFLTRPQVARMLWAARRAYPHIATFIRLAVYTGARRGAILQLTWDRVDLKAGTVDYRLPGVRHDRKRRAVAALPARLVHHLSHQARRSTSTHVIAYRARPIKNPKRAFRLVAKAAGVPKVTPHILKHTAATWALRVTSPWIVSGQLATSMRTLQSVYGKHMVDDQRAAAEAVARSGITRKIRAKPAKRKATRKRRSAKKSRRK